MNEPRLQEVIRSEEKLRNLLGFPSELVVRKQLSAPPSKIWRPTWKKATRSVFTRALDENVALRKRWMIKRIIKNVDHGFAVLGEAQTQLGSETKLSRHCHPSKSSMLKSIDERNRKDP